MQPPRSAPPAGVAGYVTDIPYTRGFKPMLAPAWLDHVALICGYAPPARTEGFTWCDLGCGQGVSAAVLAATHPPGQFHAIDAMPVHIEHARHLAGTAAIGNLHCHASDFAAAADLSLPQFDYIVAHGVYSWVGEPVREALRRFIDRRLKPGGLVYLSYNAMPGWLGDLPFQRLARELSAAFSGDSAARFAAAAALVQRLAAARLPALCDSHIVEEMAAHPADYPLGYLVHEFMHSGWEALYVTEVRRDVATIGLHPVGSATLIENYDRWLLPRQARAMLGEVADEDLREMLRDVWIDQRLRCDVFSRDARRLDGAEQRRLLCDRGLALMRSADTVTYAMTTPAGRVAYDNAAARAVVAGLAAGARSLAEIAAPGIAPADLLASALALCAAGEVRPVETGRAPVEAINRALGQSGIPLRALPFGTAIEIERRPADESTIGSSGSVVPAQAGIQEQ